MASTSTALDDTVGWYPPQPPNPTEEATLSKEELQKILVDKKAHSDRKFAPPHPMWDNDKLKYTSQNWWSPGLSKEKRENCRRSTIAGVEVRDLQPPHFLAGEQGEYILVSFSSSITATLPFK